MFHFYRAYLRRPSWIPVGHWYNPVFQAYLWRSRFDMWTTTEHVAECGCVVWSRHGEVVMSMGEVDCEVDH